MEQSGQDLPGRTTMWKHLLFWIRDLVLAIFIALVVILFLYQPVKVEGTSMLPTLEDQERVFINKFVYRLGLERIQRGDTVVFWFPGDPSKSYIKRVIGLPGDRVEVRAGYVFVNGYPISEPYVPEDFRDKSNMAPVMVPENHYFVMGDHRSSSNDSRHWGPLPARAIYGKAVFAYWPLERLGIVQ